MLVTINLFYLYQRTIFIPSKRAHQKGKPINVKICLQIVNGVPLVKKENKPPFITKKKKYNKIRLYN